MVGIGGAGFLNDVIVSVHDIMPRAAMPMVVASEIEDARSSEIESDVGIVSKLIQEVARISGFVSARAVVGAAHVSACSDAHVRPALPHSQCISAHGDHRRLGTLMPALRRRSTIHHGAN